jgi:hypothetical protein
MDEMSGRGVRNRATAVAVASAAAAAALPLLAGDARSVAGLLALAASLVATQALVLTPVVLPVALALYGAECVVAVETAGASPWIVTPVGAALLLLAESAGLRDRVPEGASVEREALWRAARQLGVTAALALAGAAVVAAADVLPARGGVAAGLVGAAAVVAALLLVVRLARLGRTDAG